jgi:farnesyl diphosphate synthase
VSSISPVNADVLKQAQQRIQQDLLTALAAFSLQNHLKQLFTMPSCLVVKVRPALCYAAASLQANQNFAAARRAAVAVELIHCYSLAHDDLPCMDNDLLRRGQPTCHVAFGEDTALLAGDILQSMAFEILGSRLFDDQAQGTDAAIVLKQMQILATASSKMVCGQVLDLQAEGKHVAQDELENIHRNKTGALIQAAIMMGAVTIYSGTDQAIPKLRQFGQSIGLAFQVQDDILDITASTETLGKTAGKDEQVQKSTYPALMGLEQAQAYAQTLHDQAFEALEYFGENAKELIEISKFLLDRKN